MNMAYLDAAGRGGCCYDNNPRGRAARMDGGNGRCQDGFVLRMTVVLLVNFSRPSGIVLPIPHSSLSLPLAR